MRILEAYLKGFAAFRRSKRQKEVWGFSIEQGQGFIGSPVNFVKNKGYLVAFQGSFLECNAYDVPFKCISLARTKTSCWTIQNVG